MKKTHLLLFMFLLINAMNAQEKSIYPTTQWNRVMPQKYGFDPKALESIREYISKNLPTTGMMIVVGGELIFEYGDVENISYLASCRKSVLATMYGKYVENGTIDLNKTIGDLNLDDIGGLLPIEKKATIRDLITARSGIYHDASNSGDDADVRPLRGSKMPGEYFLYNNWDFNAAGEVFEMLTQKNIYEAFQGDIAKSIGMQDFKLSNQQKGGDLTVSKFPAYHFYFSTRDMARFAYLMLRNGKWEDKQVVSPKWIKTITSVVTPLDQIIPDRRRDVVEYGYMWWLFKMDDNPAFDGAYTAKGLRGQFMTVLPVLDMVVALKTDAGTLTTTWKDYYNLLIRIAETKL